MKKITIIGAGLSGLYAAYLLKNKYEITIIEARDRVGGRILTKDTHDLGPSWVWSHHKNVLAIINEFNLTLEPQYTKGLALYQTPSAVERFTPPPSAPQARVVGGLGKLIDVLMSELQTIEIHLNQEVYKVLDTDTTLHVKTSSMQIESDIVLMTLPPRLASKIEYNPALDSTVLQSLQNTPTWMGHSRKCVIEFNKDFWKDAGLSGFCFSHSGLFSEIHDASTHKHPALFGFVNSKVDEHDIEAAAIKQLVELFGEEANTYTNFYDISWRNEKFSATNEDKSLRKHPEYGFSLSACNNKLHFISTESSYEAGGYLEGAVIAAKEISKQLWFCHNKPT